MNKIRILKTFRNMKTFKVEDDDGDIIMQGNIAVDTAHEPAVCLPARSSGFCQLSMEAFTR